MNHFFLIKGITYLLYYRNFGADGRTDFDRARLERLVREHTLPRYLGRGAKPNRPPQT